MGAPILPPLVEAELVFELDAKVENDIIREIAGEIAEELRQWVADLIENPPSPAVKLAPREQFMRFMSYIVAVYPNDPVARIAELTWLLNPEYISLIHQGIAPPPLAMPWRGLLPVYFAFDELQKKFAHLYATYGEPLS